MWYANSEIDIKCLCVQMQNVYNFCFFFSFLTKREWKKKLQLVFMYNIQTHTNYLWWYPIWSQSQVSMRRSAGEEQIKAIWVYFPHYFCCFECFLFFVCCTYTLFLSFARDNLQLTRNVHVFLVGVYVHKVKICQQVIGHKIWTIPLGVRCCCPKLKPFLI